MDELKKEEPSTSLLSGDESCLSESGLEIVSPHKSIVTAQEDDDSVPQIGRISTAWIGHLGK